MRHHGRPLLKHLVDRTHLGQLSFPSGHTASAMALGVLRSRRTQLAELLPAALRRRDATAKPLRA